MYTSEIETMLSRTIRTHLEVKQETDVHFQVGTVILRFLSIFKKCKASSPFEALNSVCLSSCQSDVIPLSRWGGDLQLSLGSPQGIQTSLHLVTWNSSVNFSHCREIQPSFESGLSQYIALETESTESLSSTYCWGKTPLEVLGENWLTSSVKDRESALILRRYVVNGTFFTLLC